MQATHNTEVLADGEARVLNTGDCAAWLDRLTAFENSHFGSDFAWSVQQSKKWAASGMAFQAAVVRGDSEEYISGSMSAFLATQASCRRLLAGECTELELMPWNSDTLGETPVLYFASVICSAPEELPFLYGILEADIREYFEAKDLRVAVGLSIAGGPAGKKHLQRNGFQVANVRYLGKYDIMFITARQARTTFWRRMLVDAPDSFIPSLEAATTT